MVNGELGHRPYEKLPFCFKFLKLLKKCHLIVNMGLGMDNSLFQINFYC